MNTSPQKITPLNVVLNKSFWLIAATALAFSPCASEASPLPNGGNITSGLGNISQNGSVMTVQQGTAKMTVDWKEFSIGKDSTVNFVQPSSSSVALNRVSGADPTVIQGHLNANGQIFLINPNGILFTPTSQVNVAGIVASTLALSDANFLSGNIKFEGSSSNAIINEGNIVAGVDSKGGNIALIAAKITNNGSINANGGAVTLGAGSKVTLDLGGTVKLSIEAGAIEALIQNGGAIRSDGGTILLTAQAADALSRTVIKNTGIIEAQTLSVGANGEIILKGGLNDKIEVGGTLNASAPKGGDGGFVETSAGQVVFSKDFSITTAASNGQFGKWLIDPEIIEIVPGTIGSTSGLPLTGTSQIGVDTLNIALSSTNIDLNASDWIDFQTNFNYSGSRNAVLNLYAPIVKLGGNISSSIASLGLNFGGTYNTTPYAGDVYVYGTSRSIFTKGGDVIFNGNIGGAITNSLSIDTSTGATTPGAIQHRSIVDGNFDVTTVTNALLTFNFTAGNKALTVIDFITGTATANGTEMTISNGSLPIGHINCPAGTVISLNASDSNSYTVTVALLGGGTTTIKPDPNGDITIPLGGLAVTGFSYTTKSANATDFGTGSNVDIYDTRNAGALLNYTAVAGGYTLNPSTAISVAGDIRISAKYFLNNSNASALVTGTGNTWQVWSSNLDPFNGSTGDVRGGLIYDFKQYNANYGVSTVLGAGNGFLYTYAPKITFSLVNNLSKTYDTSNAATGLTGHYSAIGAVDGDTIGENGGSPLPTAGTYASHNVGTGINVVATGISDASIAAYHSTVATPVYGYGLESTIATGTIGIITKADISAISGITANNKTYDGNTDATLNLSAANFVGGFAGDDLTVATATGAFVDKNVGTGKTVNITGLSLGGSDAVNYNLLNTTASSTANITKLTLTDITGITADDKIYNADTLATIHTGGATFVGKISGDTLTLASASGTFANKNANALPKTVTISGLALGGVDSINYNLPTHTVTTSATISKADISAITGVSADNKTYDGSKVATLSTAGAGFTGIIGSDILTVASSTGEFSDKNVGDGKTVNIFNLTLGGADSINYNLLTTTATSTANITKANISAITGITADSKIYNSNADATLNVSGAGFTGRFSGDILTVATSTGAFVDPHAGLGKTVNITALSLGGADAGNYNLLSTTASAIADITKASISAISGITANNKTYDGNRVATLDTSAAIFNGAYAGDDLTIATSTGRFSDKNVGVGKTVNITALSLGGLDAENYTLTSDTASTTANITKANISTITGITANNKIYDSTTDATLNLGSAVFNGAISGDVLSVATATGTFVDEHVGTGITVDITNLSLGGTDAGNYNLVSTVATASANIIALEISAISGITGITANNKTYDGNNDAILDVHLAAFPGSIEGDNLSVATYTGKFTDKNVGVGKLVNITGLSLGGADAANYILLNTTATTTADITKADITHISGITANNKVYDGGKVAVLNLPGAVFNGIIGSDVLVVGAGAVGEFNNKNVGNAKPVSVSGLILEGADAGNYNLVSTIASTTANITKANIAAITGITADDKVYDGNKVATLSYATAGFTGIIGSDVLTVGAGASGEFNDKNAGTHKTVSITGLNLGGADAGNYNLDSTLASATADITKAAIGAITGVTANNRAYNSTTNATLNIDAASFTGKIGSDNLIVQTSTGTFTDPHVGIGKTVNITNLTLGGTDAGNYSLLSNVATTTADISKADISAITGITSDNKTYDGNDSASLNISAASFTGAFTGDDLIVGTSTGKFNNKNVGTGKTVSITNLSLGGSDAENYNLVDCTATTTANISKLTLIDITGITGIDRVYNADTDASLQTVSASFVGKIAGDQLSITSATGTFANKRVSTNKTVSITNIALGDIDAGNYNLPVSALFTTASITKADISAVTGITANNKTYDSSKVAVLNLGAANFTGIIGSDNLTVATASGEFSDKNAGNSKTVNITGLTLGGADSGNYNLLLDTASTTANISKATITSVSGIIAIDRVYDGSNSASLNVTTANFNGILNLDSLTVATASGEFSDKNVGNDKAVSITGLSLGGADAINYNLVDTTASANADITKADISAITGITANNKAYDGNTTATLNVVAAGFTGIIGDDNLTVATASGEFDNPSIKTGKTVYITGLSLGGASAGNYHLLSTIATTTANITAATQPANPQEFINVGNAVPLFPDFSPTLTLYGQSQLNHDGINFIVNHINNGIISGAQASDYLPISLDSEDGAHRGRKQNGAQHRQTEIKDGGTDVRSAHGPIDALTDENVIHSEKK